MATAHIVACWDLQPLKAHQRRRLAWVWHGVNHLNWLGMLNREQQQQQHSRPPQQLMAVHATRPLHRRPVVQQQNSMNHRLANVQSWKQRRTARVSQKLQWRTLRQKQAVKLKELHPLLLPPEQQKTMQGGQPQPVQWRGWTAQQCRSRYWKLHGQQSQPEQ